MPNMNGYEVTQRVRQQEEGTKKHVIIVAMTAGVLSGERASAYQAGMDDFLAKPLLINDLRVVLDKFVPTGIGRATEERTIEEMGDSYVPKPKKGKITPQRNLKKIISKEKIEEKHKKITSKEKIEEKQKTKRKPAKVKQAPTVVSNTDLSALLTFLQQQQKQQQQQHARSLPPLMVLAIVVSSVCFMGSLIFMLTAK